MRARRHSDRGNEGARRGPTRAWATAVVATCLVGVSACAPSDADLENPTASPTSVPVETSAPSGSPRSEPTNDPFNVSLDAAALGGEPDAAALAVGDGRYALAVVAGPQIAATLYSVSPEGTAAPLIALGERGQGWSIVAASAEADWVLLSGFNDGFHGQWTTLVRLSDGTVLERFDNVEGWVTGTRLEHAGPFADGSELWLSTAYESEDPYAPGQVELTLRTADGTETGIDADGAEGMTLYLGPVGDAGETAVVYGSRLENPYNGESAGPSRAWLVEVAAPTATPIDVDWDGAADCSDGLTWFGWASTAADSGVAARCNDWSVMLPFDGGAAQVLGPYDEVLAERATSAGITVTGLTSDPSVTTTTAVDGVTRFESESQAALLYADGSTYTVLGGELDHVSLYPLTR